MKRLLCAVAAIAMMAPTATAAQRQNNRPDKNRTEQSRPAKQRPESRPLKPSRPENRPMKPNRPENRPMKPTRPENRPAKPTRPENRPMKPTRPGRPEIQPTKPARPVYRPGHRPSTYHRIRARPFHYPRGYRYRRWGIGLILPHIFLSNYYYWNDWAALGLGPPPPGFVWVRYGPDLLLVNRYTGRIADVIYGAFY